MVTNVQPKLVDLLKNKPTLQEAFELLEEE